MGKIKVERRCVFCRKVRSVTDLIRTARVSEETVLDRRGKVQGRGAYICKDRKCIEGAKKTRGLERSLKCRVGEEIYIDMLKEFADETR